MDLVRGIRNSKGDESAFVNEAVQEIKEELKDPSLTVKSIAIEKLTYLQMLGYDMNWAAFQVIEVMSCPKFSQKRIGYLACSQSFREETSVILLTTNLFKKDMTGQGGGALSTHATLSQYEAGIALNCLANICTKDLARDLAADVVALLNSSRVYVRKKAILCMYKIFLRFPKALRPSFPRLKDKLEDPDMAVVSSAVNVICELARKNPKNYLGLAPIFFKILTMNTNNWMLIKIVKLFGALTPLERRLGKKLLEPLSNLINTTSATSLLYECIQTCIVGLNEHPFLIKLCITKLRAFVEDPDQNLKYLGLLALHKIMQYHPKAVMEHREMVITCLDGEDVTIRSRALDLLTGMVTKRNIMEIVQKLMEKLEFAELEYADKLVEKIIAICSQNTYGLITDFEWYINVLMELTHVKNTSHGDLISSQLLDISIRVKAIRAVSVTNMVSLLRDPRLLTDSHVSNSLQEVLYAAAYIVGEFAELVDDHFQVVEYLLQPRVAQLRPHIQSIFILNSLKLFSFVAGQVDGAPEDPADEEEEFDQEYLQDMIDLMKDCLPLLTKSVHTEVQERACFTLELVNSMEQQMKDNQSGLGVAISCIFDEPLNPVAPKAQRKVPVPEGLDLEAQINDYDSDSGSEDFGSEFWKGKAFGFPGGEDTHAAQTQAQALGGGDYGGYQGKSGHGASPWMLGSGPRGGYEDEFANHSVEQLSASDINMANDLDGSYRIGDRLRRKKKGRRGRREKVTVAAVEEMPEGAVDSDEDSKKKKKRRDLDDDDEDLSTIDLTEALRPDEELPVRQHYVAPTAAAIADPEKRERSHRDKDGRRHRSSRDKEGRRRRHRSQSKKAQESAGGELLNLTSGGYGPEQPQESGRSAGQLLDDVFGGLGGAKPAAEAKVADQNTSLTAGNRKSSGSFSSIAPPMVGGFQSGHVQQQDTSATQAGDRSSRRRKEDGRRHRSSSRKGEDGKRRERKSRSRQDDQGSSSQAASSPAADLVSLVSSPSQEAPPQQQVQQRAQQELARPPLAAGKDDNVQVIYDVQMVPGTPNKLVVMIGLKSNASVPLNTFIFGLDSNSNCKVVEQAPVSPQFTLQPGGSCSTKAIVLIDNITASGNGMQCSLAYNLVRVCDFTFSPFFNCLLSQIQTTHSYLYAYTTSTVGQSLW